MGSVSCIGRMTGAAATDITPMVVEVPAQAMMVTPIGEAKNAVVNGEHWIVYDGKLHMDIDRVWVWQRKDVTTNGYH